MVRRVKYRNRRVDTTLPIFRMRIPSDIAPVLRGQSLTFELPTPGQPPVIVVAKCGVEIKFALQTRHPDIADLRAHAAASQAMEAFHRARSGDVMRLTHKQLVALAGETYRLFVETYDEEPETPGFWASLKGINRALREGRIAAVGAIRPGGYQDESTLARELFGIDLSSGIDALPPQARSDNTMEARFGLLADWTLLRNRIPKLDPGTRERFLVEIDRAMELAAWHNKRKAGGDWSPDPAAARFPPIERVAPKVSLAAIIEAWTVEAKATGVARSTVDQYCRAMNGLRDHVGHDDASRMRGEDIVSFKNARLAVVNPRTGKAISPNTVSSSTLSGVKTILAWAVDNKMLKDNPAEGVRIKGVKRRRERDPSFSDQEAGAILAHADSFAADMTTKHKAAMRWAPWIQAYTGCRVGEASQLRKADIRQVDGVWTFRLTPEAGRMKNHEPRTVLMHAHLVEMGLPAFAQAAPDGHLFATIGKDGTVIGSLGGLRAALGRMVREVVSDPDVQPNHGWRHRYKTVCRDVGIQKVVVDAIQGHTAKSISDAYGTVTLKAQADAMAKFPRQAPMPQEGH